MICIHNACGVSYYMTLFVVKFANKLSTIFLYQGLKIYYVIKLTLGWRDMCLISPTNLVFVLNLLQANTNELTFYDMLLNCTCLLKTHVWHYLSIRNIQNKIGKRKRNDVYSGSWHRLHIEPLRCILYTFHNLLAQSWRYITVINPKTHTTPMSECIHFVNRILF